MSQLKQVCLFQCNICERIFDSHEALKKHDDYVKELLQNW